MVDEEIYKENLEDNMEAESIQNMIPLLAFSSSQYPSFLLKTADKTKQNIFLITQTICKPAYLLIARLMKKYKSNLAVLSLHVDNIFLCPVTNFFRKKKEKRK